MNAKMKDLPGLVYPLKVCKIIVFDFSGDNCNISENWKQWLCKVVGGGGEGVNKVHYGLHENGEQE